MPENSLVAGKTLAELHIRRQFGVLVQAIRREGKFISYPNGASDLQPGDRLLLCGNFHALTKASYWIAPIEPDKQLVAVPLATLIEPLREEAI